MSRIVLIIVVLIAQCISVLPFDETHASIVARSQTGNFPEVISELETLKRENPDEFAAREYGYLLARMYESNGQTGNAAAAFHAVANSGSAMREYALWRLSQIARASGDQFQERLLLQEIVVVAPDSLLLDAAQRRLAKGYYESRNYAEAIRVLTGPRIKNSTTSDAAPDEPARREELVLLANSYLHEGNTATARSIFERLISETATQQQPDDIALESVRGLDVIDAASSSEMVLTAAEYVRRGWIYQFNREFIEARGHYLAVVNRYSDDPLAAEAAYQIGRGYASLESFAEAFPWFERVLEQFPELPIAKDALLQAGSAYTRVGKHREAISRYRQYIDRFPDDVRLDRAYLNIIDVARDSGEETAALRQAVEAQQVFKGKIGEAQALFSEARIHISVEDWEKALDSLIRLSRLPDLGGTRVPGGTTPAEVSFLRGFVLEKLGRGAEAIEVYLSIPDGRNEYYGWRSTERLMLMAASDVGRPLVVEKLSALSLGSTSADLETRRKAVQAMLRLTIDEGSRAMLLDALRKIYAELPAYSAAPGISNPVASEWQWPEKPTGGTSDDRHRKIAEKLLFLGLFDEAAPELEKTLEPIDRDAALRLAFIYAAGNTAHRGLAVIEPAWRGVPADYQIELIPPESIKLLYPAPFRRRVADAAQPRNIDPRFLLSIMRQESRFQPDAKSVAAARGLMQFIPQTSGQIARELGIETFEQDDLYNPSIGILFGAQYVGNLFRLFPNQPDSVAASYNGGESNVRRWMKRANTGEPERLVPEIAFSQSKDYVYKVMANYRIYRVFYTAELDQAVR